MSEAYYNEHDPKAAAWIRELIKEGHIAPGVVDERSITEVKPHEITHYTQCHFFAGIGGWSVALRMAGWPDDRRAWTGSCPCQPFSGAGQGLAEADPRHLWPAFCNIIRGGKPSIVFGEQVASKLGREWLAGVFADLEAMGYQRAGADLCAAGLGSPHRRQRLYWMANTGGQRVSSGGRRENDESAQRACGEEWEQRVRSDVGATGPAVRMALPNGGNASAEGLQRGREHGQQPTDGALGVGLADTKRKRLEGFAGNGDNRNKPGRIDAEQAGSTAEGCGIGWLADARHEPARWGSGCGEEEGGRSFSQFTGHRAWSHFDLIPCRDGKSRRIESGTFPLAHGVSHRMGLLRGYGNAIVPQVAAQFIKACEESIADLAGK